MYLTIDAPSLLLVADSGFDRVVELIKFLNEK